MRTTLRVLALPLLWILLVGAPAGAQVTFSVEGTGTSLTRLGLVLAPGDGVSRSMLLEGAAATRKALVASGYFSVAIMPPDTPFDATGAPWADGSRGYPVRIAARASGPDARRVVLEIANPGIAGSSYRREFEIVDGTDRDIGLATANLLYEYFLERVGYFADPLLYVQRVRIGGRTEFRIVRSDVLGGNETVLARSRTEFISPRIAPDGRTLVYTAIRGDRPQLYARQVPNGAETRLFPDREIRFSLAVGPGNVAYYTKIVNGNADLYRSTIGSRRETQLTGGIAIETAPSVSPNGDRIAYVSDASGPQRIFVQSLADNSRRVVGAGSGSYGSPAWSPDGRSLAVAIQSRGAFSIAVIDLATNEERLLSTSFFEEHPVWAANGRVLVFERSGRSGNQESSLWQVDVDSAHTSRLPIEGSPRDPSWVPSAR